MKKALIVAFILADVAIMGACAVYLARHIMSSSVDRAGMASKFRTLTTDSSTAMANAVKNTATPPSSKTDSPLPSTSPGDTAPPAVAPGHAATPAATAAAPAATTVPLSMKPALNPAEPAAPAASASNNHNVLFSYYNSKAREVFIRADFTGWRAEPMRKVSASKWTFATVLTPGEYAYCYSVDGRSMKDPANKRTKRVGQTIVSAKVVGPLTPAKSSPEP